MHRVTSERPYPLLDTAATRRLEQAAMASLPPHTLMQRAGLAVARLALAVAPHARSVWVACGPGNNGGDGLEAALHLQQWGKAPVVTWLGDPARAPADARASLQRAQAAGVRFSETPPVQPELCIDALLGLGATRPPEGRMADWLARMNTGAAPVLCVDLPSGLSPDTGAYAIHLIADNDHPARTSARFTLSLLALKPGLFTAGGRDAAGEVWLDDLGVAPQDGAACAWLSGASAARQRPHASHKGSYGDVAVLGGAPGMAGAALLAGSASLHGGAGRVFVALLDGGSLGVDPGRPELMLRAPDALDLRAMTVVCGCGGGKAVRAVLPRVLSLAARAVLDADALNAIAADPQLQMLLQARTRRGLPTVLTPHPLEAARLLGLSTAQVQADRLAAARRLAGQHGGVVVLKGSGTVIAAPGRLPSINPTGNARLATAGTGDVLAGLLGARLASGLPAFEAACEAVHDHGLAADRWPVGQALTATHLAQKIS
ncbi:NAD(P)H-hydrate dehydratase [Variovorax terrae]|uniref:Bifunctional NAD(P)H-hydrate repair enzyme n=1 Tax=Variovorax terrae TaxID=2923278 RepID=A0A9X1VU64_9BURK|nr:NAD(P)H-hydrate dehydratase [Variovorax terrae]MCJ0763005.1 NAD(P)H-hydrate dehydratase [Variovorax terrae]